MSSGREYQEDVYFSANVRLHWHVSYLSQTANVRLHWHVSYL